MILWSINPFCTQDSRSPAPGSFVFPDMQQQKMCTPAEVKRAQWGDGGQSLANRWNLVDTGNWVVTTWTATRKTKYPKLVAIRVLWFKIIALLTSAHCYFIRYLCSIETGVNLLRWVWMLPDCRADLEKSALKGHSALIRAQGDLRESVGEESRQIC
jgi:hypothetical protein